MKEAPVVLNHRGLFVFASIRRGSDRVLLH